MNITAQNALEEGLVLAVGKEHSITIDSDYTVRVEGIPCGTLADNLRWFNATEVPYIDKITEIVYVQPYVWSIKHLHTRHTEFVKLSEAQQEDILERASNNCIS